MPARKKVVAKAKGGTRSASPKPSRAKVAKTPAKPAPKPAAKPAPKAQPKPVVAHAHRVHAEPPLKARAHARPIDVMEIDWALFGELSRALALKVARDFDPDLVIGIATAGVIPGATVAAILDVEFHSMIISRRYHADTVRATPAVFGNVPAEVRGQHVLIVDETCDSGATLRLAVSALRNAGAADVRTAVSFRTGSYKPDYVALETEAAIVLPWDREILVDGDLVLNPEYADVIGIR
jgi:hypoxanthine phosphoribosyltransferase